jgi:hypothetical protein
MVSTKSHLLFSPPVGEEEQKDLSASDDEEDTACIYCSDLFSRSKTGQH